MSIGTVSRTLNLLTKAQSRVFPSMGASQKLVATVLISIKCMPDRDKFFNLSDDEFLTKLKEITDVMVRKE